MTSEHLLLESRRFRVVRQVYQTPDGREHIRDTVRHPGAVTILPLLDGDRVCLIRNYRVAVGKTLTELPAGTLEPNEPPLETARRELEEETGYRAETLEPLLGFFMSPGILNERMHCFVARGLTPGTRRLDCGEQIENLEVDWSEALEMVERGEIEDAKSVAVLMYYQWRRQRG